MRTIIAISVLAAMFGAGCYSGTEVEVELKEVTADELNAAVRAAASAVVESPGFEATTTWFNESGAPDRVAWLDYRSNGDNAHLLAHSGTLTGFVQVDNWRTEATRGPNINEPWAAINPLPQRTIPLHIDLEDMAKRGAAISGREALVQGYRSAWAEGVDLWTLQEVGEGWSIMHDWLIGTDGVLVSYSVADFDDTAGETFSNVRLGFKPLDNPTRIELPDQGESLAWHDFSLIDRLPLLHQ